jgi:hypothetical protein
MENVELNKTDRREAIKIIGGLIVVGAGLAPLSALAGKPSLAKGVKDLRAAPGNTAGPPPGAPLATPPTVKINRLPGATQEEVVARLLGHVAPGVALGHATVVSVRGVRLGAASVTLKHRNGATFQVDICRHDSSAGALAPIAATKRYDLFLSNGGRGRQRTGMDLHQVIHSLSEVIRANEARLPRLAVLPLRERLRRYPRGRFDASL